MLAAKGSHTPSQWQKCMFLCSGLIHPPQFILVISLAGSINRTPTLIQRQARRLSYGYLSRADTRSAPTYFLIVLFTRYDFILYPKFFLFTHYYLLITYYCISSYTLYAIRYLIFCFLNLFIYSLLITHHSLLTLKSRFRQCPDTKKTG